MSPNTLCRSGLALLLAAGFAKQAVADDAPATPAAPANYWDTFALSGHLEAGFTFNPDQPKSRENVGQLFTDKANQLLINQLLLTAARPLDPKATGYDVGFKFQAMYGTDARYTHFLDEFDRNIHDRGQVDIVEANVSVHVPLFTDGGSEIKIGQYPTPLGYEVIDASANPFYSHSYIFNFGIPLKHTGGYVTTHVNDTLDLYYGADTGVNTFIGSGDNNGSISYLGGFGLNSLLDGNLNVLALAHIGPELARPTPGANTLDRELYDAVITYKYSDALNFTTELNYAKDDSSSKNDAYGIAQYASYTVNDNVTLNARGEFFRDNNGFFTGVFPGYLDFTSAERGIPNTTQALPGNSYGELTLGAALKPPVPDAITGTVIRPELRYDGSFENKKVFDDGKQDHQFTAAVDAVVPF